MANPPQYLNVHILSGNTGMTGWALAQSLEAQFITTTRFKLHLHSHVRSSGQVEAAVNAAKRDHGIVIHTLVALELVGLVRQFGAAQGVVIIDLLTSPLNTLTEELGVIPSGEAGHIPDPLHVQRVIAMDFAIRHDDGNNHNDLPEQADLVLIGISRISKTPTSYCCAALGKKTGNIPLTPIDGEIPIEYQNTLSNPLLKGKIILLDARVGDIIEGRMDRLASLGNHASIGSYTNADQLQTALMMARRMATAYGWPKVWARKGAEDTAAAVMTAYASPRMVTLREDARAAPKAE